MNVHRVLDWNGWVLFVEISSLMRNTCSWLGHCSRDLHIYQLPLTHILTDSNITRPWLNEQRRRLGECHRTRIIFRCKKQASTGGNRYFRNCKMRMENIGNKRVIEVEGFNLDSRFCVWLWLLMRRVQRISLLNWAFWVKNGSCDIDKEWWVKNHLILSEGGGECAPER